MSIVELLAGVLLFPASRRVRVPPEPEWDVGGIRFLVRLANSGLTVSEIAQRCHASVEVIERELRGMRFRFAEVEPVSCETSTGEIMELPPPPAVEMEVPTEVEQSPVEAVEAPELLAFMGVEVEKFQGGTEVEMGPAPVEQLSEAVRKMVSSTEGKRLEQDECLEWIRGEFHRTGVLPSFTKVRTTLGLSNGTAHRYRERVKLEIEGKKAA